TGQLSGGCRPGPASVPVRGRPRPTPRLTATRAALVDLTAQQATAHRAEDGAERAITAAGDLVAGQAAHGRTDQQARGAIIPAAIVTAVMTTPDARATMDAVAGVIVAATVIAAVTIIPVIAVVTAAAVPAFHAGHI